ncbi:hypothetical protein [Paenibacillus agricola]|uniref:hypothetical protein n=1 Tax=Paenibacillus agricola TaxID=2716264 RepID=UPI001A9EB2D1|nr:hypothetical protein [Paenibacillus agricola]
MGDRFHHGSNVIIGLIGLEGVSMSVEIVALLTYRPFPGKCNLNGRWQCIWAILSHLIYSFSTINIKHSIYVETDGDFIVDISSTSKKPALGAGLQWGRTTV